MIREREAQTTINAAIQTARRVHVEDEALTPVDISIDDITDLDEAIDLWRTADQMLKAIKAVKAATGTQLAYLLGVGGAAAVGETILRYKHGTTERCHDPEGFTAYTMNELLERRVRLGDVVNPNTVKKSWMEPAVRDTFFERIPDDAPRLVEVPRIRAPKFLQGLADGDVFVKAGGDE